MAFGVKIRRIETDRAYSIERFYEAIQGKTFTAGEPSLTRHGLANIVTFPALDRQNQVQILPVGLERETRRFQIRKAEAAGGGDMIGNIAPEQVTDGLFGIGQVVGGHAKRCEELVDMTARELEMIHL